MTPNQFIARTRSAIERGTRYKLGKGGMKPTAARPSDANDECDCSGFVCWALGLSRQTSHPLYLKFNGGWINTDAMVNDAREVTGLFKSAPLIVPGVILVYPRGRTHKVGHCGIVTSVGATTLEMRIVHCSAGNFKKGDAIQETNARVFQTPDTVAIWYEGLGQDAMAGNPKFG